MYLSLKCGKVLLKAENKQKSKKRRCLTVSLFSHVYRFQWQSFDIKRSVNKLKKKEEEVNGQSCHKFINRLVEGSTS